MSELPPPTSIEEEPTEAELATFDMEAERVRLQESGYHVKRFMDPTEPAVAPKEWEANTTSESP